MVMSVIDLLERNLDPHEEDIRSWLEGNFCRCTGYRNIISAVRAAADKIRDTGDLAIGPPARERAP
jgi:carbon-monoxide dehydrogenase small subunit